MNIVWNADKYTKDFSFVHQYGDDVAELMDCKQGSTVIDLGCGGKKQEMTMEMKLQIMRLREKCVIVVRM